MDPLSISTSIITLLQATTAIISICYNFRAALKNTPWSLTNIIEELKCLRNILESLEELAQNLDEPSGLRNRPIFKLLSNPENGALAICLRELSVLDKKIKSSAFVGITGLKRKAALQALGWQLRDKDAKECLERIDRCKNTLSIALTGDEAKLLVNIRDLVTSLQATTQNIDYKVTVVMDNIRSKDLDQERTAIMHWLSPVDPCENHEAALSAHQEGTANWILESKEFIEWYQAKSSFLWLSGFPGVGKTIVFSHIVGHLTYRDDSSEGVGIAYFYCNFTRSEFQCARNLIGSLIAQLCSQFQYPEELVLAYKSSLTPGQRRRPSWELLDQTLIWFSRSLRIMILIDALDECENREEVLKLLSKLREDKAQIGVLVTSREEADIEAAFRSFPRLRMEDHFVEVERDIESYVNQRLEVDPNLKRLPLTVKAEIKLSLNGKCAGLFRWAQCQLDALSQLRTTRAIRTSLNQLPKGLNETYANILKRTHEEDIELLRRVLLWVSFTVLPLTIEELQEAVAVEAGMIGLDDVEESRLHNPKFILSLGGSLLSVSDKGHVKLAHLSVKDYLLSSDIKRRPDVSIFALSLEEASQELAVNCLTYLSLDSLACGPSETTDDWAERLARHPLLKHAAKAWTYYFRAAGSTLKLNSIVSNFFSVKSQESFMSWVQVLNSNWIFKWNQYPRHATPLYYAASFGLGEIVDDLIQSGVDLNAPGSRFGGTALHGATLREHTSVMKSLLKAGANPSQADFNLITPLHTAVRIGNVEVIMLLLEFGASKTATDSLGETPYDWAMKAGQEVSQKLLRGEVVQISAHQQKLKEEIVYRRTIANFPAMAVAQGLTLPSSKEKS